MLIVVSQPFFRQRQAVQDVTPTCSSHRERLTTAGLAMGCMLPFDSILTRQILPDARRTLVYHKHGFWRDEDVPYVLVGATFDN